MFDLHDYLSGLRKANLISFEKATLTLLGRKKTRHVFIVPTAAPTIASVFSSTINACHVTKQCLKAR